MKAIGWIGCCWTLSMELTRYFHRVTEYCRVISKQIYFKVVLRFRYCTVECYLPYDPMTTVAGHLSQQTPRHALCRQTLETLLLLAVPVATTLGTGTYSIMRSSSLSRLGSGGLVGLAKGTWVILTIFSGYTCLESH